jgi:hypothetical protein
LLLTKKYVILKMPSILYTIENDCLVLDYSVSLYKFKFNKISEKLKTATEFERTVFQISPSGYGIHRPLIDENIAIKSLIDQYQKK